MEFLCQNENDQTLKRVDALAHQLPYLDKNQVALMEDRLEEAQKALQNLEASQKIEEQMKKT